MIYIPRVFVKSAIPAVIAGIAILAAGCGGGGGSSTPAAATTLSGTAAAGAAIIGQVTVKGSAGNTKSALIEANGNYNVDVSNLTAPYILRAEGTVGGRSYTLHSYAAEADVGATVNITPFTDLIVANAAGQIASAFFDAGNFTNLTSEEIDVQEAALQDKLAGVFTSLGLDSAIDLLNTSFSADHSGLDAALDMISVEVDAVTNIATITNLIDNTTVEDDVADATDNSVTLAVSSNLSTVQTDYEAMSDKAASLTALFAAGLPTTTQLDPLFAADFLSGDAGKDQFLTDISTNPALVGITFGNVSYEAYDETAGTSTILFNVTFNGVTDAEPSRWFMEKSTGGVWQFRGDQNIADVWFNFICDNNTQNSTQTTQTCGVNVGVEDNDFSNTPGLSGTAIASARMTLQRDGVAVSGAVIYLGTPSSGTAGELFIYDSDYNDDFMAFGTTAWDNIDSALFQAGDVMQIELFTAPLDISNATSPQVTGTAVQTVSRYVIAAPVSDAASASYPAASAATLTALDAFATGNLDVSWTVPASQVFDGVWLGATQGATYLNVEHWRPGSTTTATTISLDTSSMDTTATDFRKELRVYSRNASGQSFLSTYVRNGVTVSDTGGTTTSLTCNTESGWNDAADSGAGAPISPHTFADFETVLADCGTALTFTAADLEGLTFTDTGESTTFNAGGTGVFTDSSGSLNFTWTVETATAGHSYMVVTGSVGGLTFRETRAIIGLSTTTPATGTVYTFRAYSEQTNYSAEDPMVRETGTDGEIWGGTMTQQ